MNLIEPITAIAECDVALPRVAALMPAFNPGDSINKAVESLVNSSCPCDIYIVDDGSRVPVREILRDFPRTTIIRLEKNGGVARALNAGAGDNSRQANRVS